VPKPAGPEQDTVSCATVKPCASSDAEQPLTPQEAGSRAGSDGVRIRSHFLAKIVLSQQELLLGLRQILGLFPIDGIAARWDTDGRPWAGGGDCRAEKLANKWDDGCDTRKSGGISTPRTRVPSSRALGFDPRDTSGAHPAGSILVSLGGRAGRGGRQHRGMGPADPGSRTARRAAATAKSAGRERIAAARISFTPSDSSSYPVNPNTLIRWQRRWRNDRSWTKKKSPSSCG
jgi:hypothetical protein